MYISKEGLLMGHVAYTVEQQKIINHREGPAFVVAGAGTGKTFTMTARVESLIESGVNPAAILVLTFSNAAANEMVGRVKKKIGPVAKDITACTFHSFCNLLMRRYCVPSKNYTILDAGDEEDLIRLVKSNSSYAQIKLPNPSQIKEVYSLCVNCNLTLQEVLMKSKFCEIMKFRDELEDFRIILQEYKREHGLVTYDDMLLYGAEILKTHGDSIRSQYRYIMVDEAQDTNYIQFYITGFLGHNIMYIGDPEQSIYGFRGSDIQLYLKVPDIFPDCQIYTLSRNYRCTQQILDVANSIIENDTIPYKAVLKTGKEYFGECPKLMRVIDQDCESEHILQSILALEKKETAAVIYKNSVLSAKLELELVSHHINYIKRGGIKFFEMSCIRDMMALFRILINSHDFLAWFRILQLNRQIGGVRANQIIKNGNHPLQNHPFQNVNTKTAKKICAQLDDLETYLTVAVQEDYQTQLKLTNEYYFKLREDNLRVLKSKSRISEKTIEMEAQSLESARRYVPVLLNLMSDYESVCIFLENISLDTSALPANIATMGEENEDASASPEQNVNVILTTIHSAKGLEWDHVYIMDTVQGMFPKHTQYECVGDIEMQKDFEESRRCMYVAVTRAKKELVIYCPDHCVLYGKHYGRFLSTFLTDSLKKNQLLEIA